MLEEMLETFLCCALGGVIGTIIVVSIHYTIVFITKIIKKHLDKKE